MSTQYPILDNRPIDQWKVTELKEELKRRRLITRGLKEELVRRLDTALREETESANEELLNGFDSHSNMEDKVEEEPDPLPESATETVEDKSEKIGNDAAMVDINDSIPNVNRVIKDQDEKTVGDANLDDRLEGTKIDAAPEDVIEFKSSGQDTRDSEMNDDMKPPPIEDIAIIIPEELNNQVPEVRQDLGFQVNCESISTDSVSINEKNELKDNLNADNFHLEVEVVKPEMVQPSSNSDPPAIGGDLHPLEDDGQELVNNQQGTLEEVGDVTCVTNVELSKKIDSADVDSPEKLNLDRSSGEESVEEDVFESKQIEESKNNSVEVGERSEEGKENNVEEPMDAVLSGFSPDKKEDMAAEEGIQLIAQIEKRKAEDQETVGINEPKRRRWNSETNIKLPEQQTTSLASSATPKDAFQPTPKRLLARSDSSVSGDAPKERVVPPSQKAATTSLRIDRFLRPFTLKAVQELLANTGTVSEFWMDHIKTHCYVTYSSAEEAIATRNAVYNLQWPPNGGRLLVAEFVDPQEVKARAEAPPQSPAPITPSPTTPTAPPFQQPQPGPPPPRHHRQQQLPPPPPLPPPPALSDPPPAREQLLPPPPPLKKPDPPIVTLDDLFKKTRATPRVYYLPLSEEQVAAKLAAQGKRIKE